MKLHTILPALLSAGAVAAPASQSIPSSILEAKATYLAEVSKRQWGIINLILAQVVALFPVNVAIQSIDDAIGKAEDTIAAVLGLSTTENDVAGGKCADVTIVFARGTTETGNVGAIVGPPFFLAVEDHLGGKSLALQGVDYPADVPGFLIGGDPTGSKTMASLITKALAACPNTKVVISGYSQGGQLVHNAAKLLPAATTARLVAVIFGDPNDGQPVQGVPAAKTLVVCHDGDNICEGGDLILLPHLTYAADAETAAAFVASNV